MDPKITIIIPTYNRAGLLPFAVKSVLSQTCEDFELLILDDASTDNTHEVVQPFLADPRVRLVSHPQNIGITTNRNYGLSIAKGAYIAMLDSDDLWFDENKLERQLEILESHPDIGIVGTYAKRIDDKEEIVGDISSHAADKSIRNNMMRQNQFIQSSVMIRVKAIEDVGRYDENIAIWEDYELWLRIGKHYQFRNIPEFLTGYRDHAGNISKESEQKSINAYQMIYKLHKKEYPNSLIMLLKIAIKKVKLWWK